MPLKSVVPPVLGTGELSAERASWPLFENGSELLVHDEKEEDASLAFLLSRENENLPTPVGVFRAVNHPTYDGLLKAQIDDYTAKRGKGDLKKLIYSGQRWTVGPKS